VLSDHSEREGVLMLPATASKRLEAIAEIAKTGKRMNGLFRLMENPELWLQAYANIYANKGAMTPGVGEVTMDGFSVERVANIIERLKEDRYRFKPSRRVYIPKANGKRRPLGLPIVGASCTSFHERSGSTRRPCGEGPGGCRCAARPARLA
jgi:RNA-directed DNA polymerase